MSCRWESLPVDCEAVVVAVLVGVCIVVVDVAWLLLVVFVVLLIVLVVDSMCRYRWLKKW
jgi:hypothetical protein